jgi:nuclear pore complex protein Nup62
MDEIITRWASDLLKYQKDFQDQAAKVALWDRLLVENGEKIQTLSDNTFEAERSTKEIESQLSTVESQQAELTSWLDRYEADVDEMFARQVGPGENLQGPDQERERTYKIAEKLTDRLDEMGKNITSMIEAINDASSNVSKNAKTDDPVSHLKNGLGSFFTDGLQLSHIVRVLNSHLTQLQWIDQNTEVLQAKVTAAQKLGQSIASNGNGGPLDDAAESFYRSYTGRR